MGIFKKITGKIKESTSDLLSEKNVEIYAQGVGKRLMEKVYDKIAAFEPVKSLQELEEHYKYLVEAVINLIGAEVTEVLPEKNFPQRVVKGTLGDSAAEISKRIFNGTKNINELGKKYSSKDLLLNLFSMDEGGITNFISQLRKTSEPERVRILKNFESLTLEAMKKYSGLDSRLRDDFSEVLKSSYFGKESIARKAEKEIDELNEYLEERLKKKKEKKNAKKDIQDKGLN